MFAAAHSLFSVQCKHVPEPIRKSIAAFRPPAPRQCYRGELPKRGAPASGRRDFRHRLPAFRLCQPTHQLPVLYLAAGGLRLQMGGGSPSSVFSPRWTLDLLGFLSDIHSAGIAGFTHVSGQA